MILNWSISARFSCPGNSSAAWPASFDAVRVIRPEPKEEPAKVLRNPSGHQAARTRRLEGSSKKSTADHEDACACLRIPADPDG